MSCELAHSLSCLQLIVFYRAILLFRIVSKIKEFIVHLSFTLDVSLEVFETWRTCSLQSVCIGQRILHICSVFRVPLPWSIFEKAAKRVLDIIKNDSHSYLYYVDVILRTTFGEFNWLQLKILATAHAKRQKFLCFVSNHYAGLLHYSINCILWKFSQLWGTSLRLNTGGKCRLEHNLGQSLAAPG